VEQRSGDQRLKKKTFFALFLMAVTLILFSTWEADSKPLLVPRWKLTHIPIVVSSCRLQGEVLQLAGKVWNDTDMSLQAVTVWFRLYDRRKRQVVSSEQQLLLRLPPGSYRTFEATVPLKTKLDRPLSGHYFNVTIIKAEIDEAQ
jgi:hypothetical protein